MTDLEILTKAIQKAQKNGYRYILSYDDENGKYYAKMLDLKKYYAIIFDHNFAIAFFGQAIREGHCFINKQYVDRLENWQWHLQQLSTVKEPLQYIKYYLGE